MPLLYHYTGRVEEENLLKIIAAELFYFSNPVHFNDVLDMQMPILAKKANETNTDFNIIATHKGVTGSVNAFNTQPEELTDFLATLLTSFSPESNEKIRVLCMTESDNIPLMWAHYGDRHQGICFGLDWKTLCKAGRVPHKVHYQNEFSLTEYGAARFEWEVNPLARTKKTDWKHEKEWRCFTSVRDKDESCVFPLSNALKTVTLGCQVSRETRKLVYSFVNRYKQSLEIRQIDVVNGQFQSNVLPMPSNFNSLNVSPIEDIINKATEECLSLGNIDAFLTVCMPYFFHLDLWSEKLRNSWAPIVAAAKITQDSILRTRVIQWCPLDLIDRSKPLQGINLNAPCDDVDIWHAYFSYVNPEEQDDALIKSIHSRDCLQPITIENRKQFLKIGWNIARRIEKSQSGTESQKFLALLESNLEMARKINDKNTNDVEVCLAMLNKFSA